MNNLHDPKLLEEARRYEVKEISYLSTGKVLTDVEYARYLALLIYKNDLCVAAALWERIPEATKIRYPDVNQLWKICEKMRDRDFAGGFSAFKRHKWAPEMSKLISQVVAKVKLQLLDMCKCGFSDFDFNSFLLTLDYSKTEGKKKIKEQGWTLIGNKVYTVEPPKEVKEPKTPTKIKEKQKEIVAEQPVEEFDCIFPEESPELPSWLKCFLRLPSTVEDDDVIVLSDG